MHRLSNMRVVATTHKVVRPSRDEGEIRCSCPLSE
jgi:hypothetical protein